MEMITAYMTGIIALIGLWAWRVPHENVRTIFVLAIIWPLSVIAIIGMIVLESTGWAFDFAKNDKMFGFRRPTNINVRGFAVTVFGIEFQFYSKRKLNKEAK